MRGITAASANLTKRIDYDPCSVPLYPDAPTVSYTGERVDVIALVYLCARYMHPDLEGILTKDPIEGVVGGIGLAMMMSGEGMEWV